MVDQIKEEWDELSTEFKELEVRLLHQWVTNLIKNIKISGGQQNLPSAIGGFEQCTKKMCKSHCTSKI